ncbi:hypothetical protein HHK36_027516 [Tetracentron sinense]|uniref:Cytochrome b561 and DOMON domain-containing protein n=1 Tax=Tetracentron sinense TaxID=13715 RepID=A0A834YDD2_TETSI|nr:hypothetical protein HHK36_027516 [Tetracentron sinense]
MADSISRVLLPSYLIVFTVLILLSEPTVFSVAADDGDVDGRSDLCNTDLTSFLPAIYSNFSGLTCTPVWNTFILRFFQTRDNVVTIILSTVYTSGWIGMGFSKDGMMVGSSAMVGWVGKEGRVRIKQYFLQGSTPSEVIVDKGELQLTDVPPVVILHGAYIYLAFQLKFAARLTHQPILLAFGTARPIHNHLSKHDDKRTFVFDFSAGKELSDPRSFIHFLKLTLLDMFELIMLGSVSSVPQNTDKLKRSHGVLGVMGWGLILPSGAIVARYYKHQEPLWYYLHTVIQFVGFIIVLAGVVAGSALYDRLHANVPAHRGIGIFALVLSILQVIAFFLRPNKDSKIRKYWNWYHHWVGRFALFFGAVNIVLGIHVGGAGDSWKIGYGFLLAINLIAVIVLEALLWIRGSEKAVQPPDFQMNPIK